jgi:hypothetical protein
MGITVSGTTITFNDATTQSTANNTPANTTNVLNATAGATVGAVGTYVFRSVFNGTWTSNSTIAGSSIQAGLAGTWRAIGTPQQTGTAVSGCATLSFNAGLYLRIS